MIRFLAAFLTIAVLLSIGIALSARDVQHRALMLAAAVLLGVGVALTLSRGGMLSLAFGLVVLVHGGLHLIGVSRGEGRGWLAGAVVVVAAGVLVLARVGWAWIVVGLAAVASEVLVVTSWSDAWAGTIVNAAMLLFDRQFENDRAGLPIAAGPFARLAVGLAIALAAANVVSTYLECGLAACADNPVVYEMLQHASR